MSYKIGEKTYTIDDIQDILDGIIENNNSELQTIALNIQEALDEGRKPPTFTPLIFEEAMNKSSEEE